MGEAARCSTTKWLLSWTPLPQPLQLAWTGSGFCCWTVLTLLPSNSPHRGVEEAIKTESKASSHWGIDSQELIHSLVLTQLDVSVQKNVQRWPWNVLPTKNTTESSLPACIDAIELPISSPLYMILLGPKSTASSCCLHLVLLLFAWNDVASRQKVWPCVWYFCLCLGDWDCCSLQEMCHRSTDLLRVCSEPAPRADQVEQGELCSAEEITLAGT